MKFQYNKSAGTVEVDKDTEYFKLIRSKNEIGDTTCHFFVDWLDNKRDRKSNNSGKIEYCIVVKIGDEAPQSFAAKIYS